MGEITKCEINIFNIIKSEITEMFDVGAYTDIDYIIMHPTAKFHLFEPMKESYEKLIQLVADNTNVKTNNVGCSNTKDTEKMYRNISSTIIKKHDIATDLNNFEYVQMVRLDEYIEQNNITTFDFIKIDTEGSEYLVLDGLGKYLNEFKFIQVEYGGTYWDVPFKDRTLLLKDIFEKLNQYHAMKLETGQIFTEYNSSLEDYTYCNYLFYKPQYNNIWNRI